jgi:single-strand DNA-binding protein
MQTIFITGALGSDAELRTTQGGDKVCSFNVGSGQGFGDRKTTNWFRVSMWGKRGDSLQPYLLKGTKVAVCGELEIGEFNGKPQYNVRANEVDLTGNRNATRQDGQATGNGGPQTRRPVEEELSDDVPFASSDFALERRAS